MEDMADESPEIFDDLYVGFGPAARCASSGAARS